MDDWFTSGLVAINHLSGTHLPASCKADTRRKPRPFVLAQDKYKAFSDVTGMEAGFVNEIPKGKDDRRKEKRTNDDERRTEQNRTEQNRTEQNRTES